MKLFISYTAEDLLTEANTVKTEAEAKSWEVVDHREWAATGRPSVQECYQRVDSCDALIVLSSKRYGWVPPKQQGGRDNKSITWLEVERARSRGIPVFPFVSATANNSTALEPDLKAFHTDLRKNVCNFFQSDTEEFIEQIRSSLDEFDGRKRDAEMSVRRRLRIWAPLLFFGSLGYFWFALAPVIWGRFFEVPILTISAWVLTPLGGAIALLLILLVVGWLLRFDHGRPQLIYRLFPLDMRGMIGLFVSTLISLVLLLFTGFISPGKDPAFEKVLHGFLDGKRNSAEVSGIQTEKWKGARNEEDLEVFREYVTPMFMARDALSGDLTLADARAKSKSLTYRVFDGIDPRVRLLVELSRFHSLALEHSAGNAIAYYKINVSPLAVGLPKIWQAESAYAFAAWTDYWAFTNKYPTLDRNGSPDYKNVGMVLDEFRKAELNDSEITDWVPWVVCAVRDTGANVLVQYCGRREDLECSGLEDRLRQAEECYVARKDGKGVQSIRYSLALRLDAKGKSLQAYKAFLRHFDEDGSVDSGLRALALQTLAPVAPLGEGVKFDEVEKALKQVKDQKRGREIYSCLDLLRRVQNQPPFYTSDDCRVAFNCYLTDGALARQTFCSVPGIGKVNESNCHPSESKVEVTTLPMEIAFIGNMQPQVKAEDIVSGCDGDVGKIPSATIDLTESALVTARVYSKGDSILLSRGKGVASCNDDAPLTEDTGKEAYNQSSAAIRSYLNPGTYEFYVGTYNEPTLEYELRVRVEAR